MDSNNSVQSLRKRRFSQKNPEIFNTLNRIDLLLSNPAETSLKGILDLLQFLSTQMKLEKEIECSFIIITASLLIADFLHPASNETLEKLKKIQSDSKLIFQRLFNLFLRPSNAKVPLSLVNESSNLLSNIREIFTNNDNCPSAKIKTLSKILSMVPSTPFELLLTSLNNLLTPSFGSSFFPSFTNPVSPFLPEYLRKAYTLVLDLDETLVHLRENKVMVRPGTREFISTLSLHYELVLFTSATPEYADYIMQFIDPNNLIKLRLYRNHTTKIPVTIKDLKNLGRDLSKVIIVDNTKESFQLQQSNGIQIKSWTGDETDSELLKLLSFLSNLPYKNFSHVSEALFPI